MNYRRSLQSELTRPIPSRHPTYSTHGYRTVLYATLHYWFSRRNRNGVVLKSSDALFINGRMTEDGRLALKELRARRGAFSAGVPCRRKRQ